MARISALLLLACASPIVALGHSPVGTRITAFRRCPQSARCRALLNVSSSQPPGTSDLLHQGVTSMDTLQKQPVTGGVIAAATGVLAVVFGSGWNQINNRFTNVVTKDYLDAKLGYLPWAFGAMGVIMVAMAVIQGVLLRDLRRDTKN